MIQRPPTSLRGRTAGAAKTWCRDHLVPHYSRLVLALAKPLREDLDRTAASNYRQLEALLGLYDTLDARRPLPSLRDWAISPDFALTLHEHVVDTRPETIIEFGSGASTIVAGYALKTTGRGQIVSFDHDADWLQRSVDLVRAHGLSDVATVHYAPLKEVSVDGEVWRWYDIDRSLLPNPIDLLVVDGPPVLTQPLARYPSLPLLKDVLAPRAVIMLDDAHRPDERRIVSLWQERYGPFIEAWVTTEKGCVFLRRPE